MHTAESILVIIVSATLTLFLAIGIVVLVLIAKLIAVVKRIVDKAEHVVTTAEEAAEVFKNASGPLVVFKLVRNILKAVDKKRK